MKRSIIKFACKDFFYHNLYGESLWLTKSGGYFGNSVFSLFSQKSIMLDKSFTDKFGLDIVFSQTAKIITDIRQANTGNNNYFSCSIVGTLKLPDDVST